MSVKRHTFLNLVGYVVPAAISLATVPLYLRSIGPERYGIWVLLWSFLSYFTSFDMGLPKAVANRIAYIGKVAEKQEQAVFWTAFWLNMGFSWIGAGLVYVAGTWSIGHIFRLDADLLVEVTNALPWLAVWLPVCALGGVAVGTLEGRECFGMTNLLQLVGFAIFQVSPLLAVLHWEPNLSIMLGAAVLSRFIYALAQFCMALITLRIRTLQGFAHGEVRRLLSFGAWSAIAGLANPIMESLDRMLTGMVLGPKSVAFYSVPYGLADKVRILPDALQRSLFPKLSKHSDTTRARDEAGRATFLLTVVMTVFVVPGMFALGPFLTLWVGPEFAAQATPLGHIFLLGMWFNAPVFMARVLLQSRGRPDLVAKFQMAELLPYAGVLWLCLQEWGLTGAALAWTLRVVTDTGLLLWKAKLWQRSLLPAIPCALLAGVAFGVAFSVNPPLEEAVIYAVGFGSCGLLLAYLASPELFRFDFGWRNWPKPKTPGAEWAE